MRMFKVLSFSLVLAAIATFATMNQWYAKNIRVTFNAKSTKEINYVLFYTANDTTWFNGQQLARKLIPAGAHSVKIILPTEKVRNFRIDFGEIPGTILISDLKLIGNETINILADEEKQYSFNQVEEHQFINGEALRITSNKGDPYMVYKKDLDVTPGDDINYNVLLTYALGTFVIAFLISLLLTRKKSEKMKENSPKNSKDKK